ncbi:transporter [Ganoderma sinense ZZ0214-1]|uniref:Transporter n=1 Tax=Ganoderma sinense ZZ0214-1 TaxID=1077348 RepID=A0A2G8SR55_9APHY|nr:transporter [Ganoderma sinense ZZ0214-1]
MASLQVIDGLHNYELKECSASEATSSVFRAICKRGRMRNRLVVVKKFPIPCKHQNDTSHGVQDVVSAASLHSTLCHPTIVTLLSSFSAPTGFYQVLEFCENGSLSDFLHARDSHTLTDEELRGVARTLVDALVYLKKEHVLHRDIKPSNVFLTGDFRLKLSGFGLAIRLPRSDSTETALCGSPNYVSPEMLLGLPYRFPTDLWSVGGVLLTCLAGQPAFHAPTSGEVFENICCARYMLPDVSYEVQDLIAGMLQKVEIYDAPHLSTPCCLAEPVATYVSRVLPTKYAKQYEDAMQIVDRLNARIPKLIHFADDAKCILMSNGPPGDVEIHVPVEDAQFDEGEAIRLRLQRSRHTLEISRHLRKTGCTRRDGGEWTKKVIPLSHALELPENEDRSLDGLERLAMTRLRDFMRVCDAAEAVLGARGPHTVDKHDGTGRERLERALRHMEGTSNDKDLGERSGARPPSEDRSRASGGSFMVVPPRPRKFSSAVTLR